MALIPCRECGKEVSSEAASCPHCGITVKKKTSAWFWVISLPVGLFIGMLILGAVVKQPASYADGARRDLCQRQVVQGHYATMEACLSAR